MSKYRIIVDNLTMITTDDLEKAKSYYEWFKFRSLCEVGHPGGKAVLLIDDGGTILQQHKGDE